jgi:tRNA (guanine10-N2)-dimethyltransferase
MDRLVLACLLLHELDQGFMSRRAHLRPSLHPSSLNPKLARAMVNLTGCKRGDTVLDPFCGTGGILLEAALVGCKTVGSDVDDIMIRRCKENLAHFHIKSPRISKADATKTGLKASYIVADLPYGKNTKQKNTTSLYGAFLRNLSRSKVKCAVLGFPDGTSISRLIAGSKLKIAHQFVIYVHKSMSKRIVVLKKSI